ncbi:FGGY family carbohydrate kinase [Actinomyces oricola]
MTSTPIDLTCTALEIEPGSTRIKAILVNDAHEVVASGGHDWENELIDGVWTYSVDAIWHGLLDAFAALAANVTERTGTTVSTVGALGISGMMYGYLPLDAEGRLLTAFRTWRNTFTLESSVAVTWLFGLNIPQHW